MNTDELNVSIAVAATPIESFRLFTEEIDLWWRGPVYRTGKQNSLRLESEVGGTSLADLQARVGETYTIVSPTS